MTPALFATTTSPPRFFLIPRDVQLLDGPLTVRDLTGTVRTLDPVVADVFEVTEAEAQQHAARTLRGFADHTPKAVRALNDITAAVHEAQKDLDASLAQKADQDALRGRFAESLGMSPEDYDAADGQEVVVHLKQAFSKVESVARDAVRGTPAERTDAEARMRAFAHTLGGGRDPKGAEALGDTLLAMTGALRSALDDPSLQVQVEALTAELRRATEEVQQATKASRQERRAQKKKGRQ
jgi:hypothetical protein